jgi:hypothetical protein
MIDDLGPPGELSGDGVSNLGNDLSYTWFNHQNIMARRTARPVTRGEAALWQGFIAHGWTQGRKAPGVSGGVNTDRIGSATVGVWAPVPHPTRYRSWPWLQP